MNLMAFATTAELANGSKPPTNTREQPVTKLLADWRFGIGGVAGEVLQVSVLRSKIASEGVASMFSRQRMESWLL